MRKLLISTAVLSIGLAACGSPEEPAEDVAAEDELATAEPMQAVAMLQTAEGEPAGFVTATGDNDGVSISLQVQNMPAGEHGVHVHMTGACEAPTFESAGGHWNPTDQSHGLEDPEGQHAGDMPNLEVGDDGTGSLQYTLQGGARFEGLMDADGSAFVVHAGADDQVTDPSGESGDRIACGVFEAGGAGLAGAAETETM